MSITAEQVREAIEENTWAETGTIRQFEDSSWQAIADELNATLGGGECEMDAHGNCTACGEFVAKSWEYVRRFDGGYKAKPCRAHNYCPNCGRKAVKR